jgi:prepilin peptidase CpaA
MMLYSKDAIGGGDVKLFAALGALCRPMIGVEAEMYGFFAAALIAPARLAYDGKLFRTLKNAALLMVNPFLPKDKKHAIEQEMMTWFRMGPAIFVGMVITAFLHWRQP